MAEARTAVDIVKLTENTLGFTHPEKLELWKSRAIEASKIKKQMVKDPKKVTFANLELAIEYSRKKKLPVKHPVTLVYRIDDALKMAAEEQQNQGATQADVDAAIAHELATQKFGYDAWMQRLSQATGPGRRKVLDDWKAAGRG